MKRDFVILYCLLLLWGLLAFASMGGYVFAGYAWWDHWGRETGTGRDMAVAAFHFFGACAAVVGTLMRLADPRF